MKLKQLTEHVFYVQDQPNIGIIKEGDTAIFIDSGANENSAAKVVKLLELEGLYPLAVINTHSHADHCGGNHFLQEKTGALIYAPETEAAIIQSPFLEPYYLYSGANPIAELKADMAKGSRVDHIIASEERFLQFDSTPLNIVKLPGHSPNQIGIEADQVLFCADAIFSEELLQYYKIPFHADILRQKSTLAWLAISDYSYYVPAHSPPLTEITALARHNLEIIEGVEQFILRSLQRRKTTEEVLKELCAHYKIAVQTVQSSYLMHTVTNAFLSSLKEQGSIYVAVKDNLPCWGKK